MRARAGVRAGRRPVAYLFFNLLWLDGRLLCPAPYAERRRLLDGLGLAGPAWQPVASFPGEGPRCWPPPARRGWRASSPSASTAPTCPAARRRLAERLAAMRVEASPFVEDPAALAGGRRRRAGGEEPPPVFVRPELTVEVTFLGWEAGRLRHATLG
jgi:ATP-dependent DNA ligase